MLATQDRGNRHQGHGLAAGGERRPQYRALVLAEQTLDPLERDRIDVPGVAGDVGDLVDAAIMRRVEAVIHARFQPQRHIAAVAMGFDSSRIAQQVLQRVRKTLGLIEFGAFDRAAGTDDRVARADQDVGRAVDRARAVLEFTDKAVVQAA